MNALTIIKKVEENKYLAPLIYYVYTKDPHQPFMTQEELLFFQEENKAYAINLENFEDLIEQEPEDIDLEEEPPQKPSQPNLNSNISPRSPANGRARQTPSTIKSLQSIGN